MCVAGWMDERYINYYYYFLYSSFLLGRRTRYIHNLHKTIKTDVSDIFQDMWCFLICVFLFGLTDWWVLKSPFNFVGRIIRVGSSSSSSAFAKCFSFYLFLCLCIMQSFFWFPFLFLVCSFGSSDCKRNPFRRCNLWHVTDYYKTLATGDLELVFIWCYVDSSFY